MAKDRESGKKEDPKEDEATAITPAPTATVEQAPAESEETKARKEFLARYRQNEMGLKELGKKIVAASDTQRRMIEEAPTLGIGKETLQKITEEVQRG